MREQDTSKPMAWALYNLVSDRVIDVTEGDPDAMYRKWGRSEYEKLVPLYPHPAPSVATPDARRVVVTEAMVAAAANTIRDERRISYGPAKSMSDDDALRVYGDMARRILTAALATPPAVGEPVVIARFSRLPGGKMHPSAHGDWCYYQQFKEVTDALRAQLATATACAARASWKYDVDRDYKSDHGDYFHASCGICRSPFYGGKGRVVCAVCLPTGEELRRLRMTYEPERIAAALAATTPGEG